MIERCSTERKRIPKPSTKFWEGKLVNLHIEFIVIRIVSPPPPIMNDRYKNNYVLK